MDGSNACIIDRARHLLGTVAGTMPDVAAAIEYFESPEGAIAGLLALIDQVRYMLDGCESGLAFQLAMEGRPSPSRATEGLQHGER